MIRNLRCGVCFLLLVMLLTGCTTVSDFYDSWLPSDYVDPESYLQEGEDPQIYYSTNINSDIYFLRSNYYWILGNSSYNGPADDSVESEIETLCRETGAKIAVYTTQYTDTRSGVTGYNGYVSSYSIRRYDYDIYLFVPMSVENILFLSRIGISYSDLSSSERLSARHNTGASIDIVYVDSPAFYANLAPGDIITEVNEEVIYDSDSLDSALASLPANQEATIKYIRDGYEQSVTLRPLY